MRRLLVLLIPALVVVYVALSLSQHSLFDDQLVADAAMFLPFDLKTASTREVRSAKHIAPVGEASDSVSLVPVAAQLVDVDGDGSETKVLKTSGDDRSDGVHDKRSLTSYMWLRGKPFNILSDDPPIDDSRNVTIDAVSIGTQYNLPQLQGQADSWASHWSMRYLFGTTEQDDADPECHLKLKPRIFEKFFPRCSYMKYNHSRLAPIRKRFPITKWIQKEGKTKGWLCAQQRFAHAVGKVGRFYRRQGSLPDYLMIQDDDTWYGMNQMVSFLSKYNQTKPFVAAGCMIQWPVHYVNFSFPYGGFGLVLNRHSIERLIKPIYCNRTADDSYTRRVCFRLSENLVGERMAFQDGMSISDIMDRHAEMLPYRRFFGWSNDPGYCMLGDWVLGYYANYYELGTRTDPKLEYIHVNRRLGYDYSHRERSCLNTGEYACRSSPTQYVCHRIEPEVMLKLHQIDAKKDVNLTFAPQPPQGQRHLAFASTNDSSLAVQPVDSLSALKRDTNTSHIFSYVWLKGRPFDQLKDQLPPPTETFTIDALTVGSQYNLPQMGGQAASWAAHPNVRLFFGVTEKDDADPHCHEELMVKEMHNILSKCSVMKHYENPLKHLKNMFPSKKWTGKEQKGVGWLCAQQRFAHAVGKIGRFYRKERSLPDYLTIQDDDTWFGMNQVVTYLQSRNNSDPFVTAGCMIQWPVQQVNFSFGFGGYGLMLNRHSIERLIRPIYCNETNSKDSYTKLVCDRLEENLVGELMAFQDGMSLSDVMDRHAAMLPYREYRIWDKETGYCMLGDWVLGYYANYYALGSPVSSQLPFLHIDSGLGYSYYKMGRSCENSGVSACKRSKTRYVCHRIQPHDMLIFSKLDQQKGNATKDHYL